MKNRKGYFLCFLVMCICLNINAQLEEHTWYFGGNGASTNTVGLRFDQATTIPAPLNNERFPLELQENNVMVTNPSTGAVVMYSDGQNVVDASHNLMPNGTGLSGSASSMYGTVIVFDPSDCDRYYLVYVEAEEDAPDRKIYYSAVDMTLTGNGTVTAPLGDVDPAVKNIEITPAGMNMGEGLLAISKPNGSKESWVLATSRNTKELFIFEVTGTGVSLSNTYDLNTFMPGLPLGEMFGFKAAFEPTTGNEGILVLGPGRGSGFPIGYITFDRANGTIDVSSYVNIATNTQWTYGIEFSPDGSKIYYTDYFSKELQQYDLNTGILTEIGSSPHSGRSGGLLLGPDGKIYWANRFEVSSGSLPVEFLSTIDDPNAAGTACNLNIDSYNIAMTGFPRTVGVLPTFGTFPTPPSASQDVAASCTIGGTATVDPGESAPPVLYEWDNGQTTATANALTPGLHFVTVTDGGGCTRVASVMIDGGSGLDFSTANMSRTNPTNCNPGNDGSILISAPVLDPNANYEVTYFLDGVQSALINVTTDANGDITITGLSPGTYTDFEIALPGGLCPGNIFPNLVLMAPGAPTAPTVGINGSACLGENLSLTATNVAGATYIWTGPNSFSSNDQNPLVSMNASLVQEGVYTLIVDVGGCQSTPTTVTVTFIQATVDLGPDQNYCGSAALTLDAGSGFVDYDWSTGSNNQTIDVTVTGTYGVTATDANGCIRMDEVIINVFPFAAPDLGGDLIFCPGDPVSAVLDPGGSFSSYTWSDGSSSPTLNANSPGLYWVEVTDVNSCVGRDSVELLQSTSVLDLGSDMDLCGVSLQTLDAGTGFDTYNWSTGAISSTIDVTSSGTYEVTVTDNLGCSLTDEVTINLFSIPIIDLGSDLIFCPDENVTGTLSLGATFPTYLWSDGSINPTLDFTNTGLYWVEITDVNGCATRDSVEVIQSSSVIDLGPDESLCGVNSFTINAGAFDSYIWSDGSTNPSLTVSNSGTYTVTVTDGFNCELTDEIEVNLFPAASVDLGPDQDFCLGLIPDITFDGGAGFAQYTWSDGSMGQTLTTNQVGTYWVEVMSADGCIGSDTVLIGTFPVIGLDLGEDLTICANDTIALEADPGYDSYIWSNGESGQEIMVSGAGEYSVLATDVNGCSAVDTINVITVSAPRIEAGEDHQIILGEQVELEAIVLNSLDTMSYLWSPVEGLSCIDCADPIAAPFVTTTYSVTVTNNVGCFDIDELTIEVDDQRHVYIPNAFSPNDDGINDKFEIYGNVAVSQVNMFRVYNRWGGLVYEVNNLPINDSGFGWDGMYKGKILPPGVFIYIAEIQYVDGQVQSYKGDVTIVR